MAAFLNDPLFLTLQGVLPSSIVIRIQRSEGAPILVYDATLGGWQPGYNGSFGAGGSGGVVPSVTTIPTTLPLGLWTVTVTATAYGGATGGGSWSFWLLLFEVEDAYQSTLNTVDVEFSWEPKHLDPEDSTDGINLANYTVVGPVAPLAERLMQAVTYEGDNTLRMWFDGSLVPGEVYSISLDNIEAVGGAAPLAPSPTTFSFTAFGADAEPVPLEQQPAQQWDIRNPQTPRDAPEAQPLGTFVIDDDGDLGVETRRQYLRKRIYRRLTTKKGEMILDPDYGITYEEKQLIRTTTLRRLQQDIESQVRQEFGVTGARAAVGQHAQFPGIVQVRLRVFDEFGDFTEELTLGGGD